MNLNSFKIFYLCAVVNTRPYLLHNAVYRSLLVDSSLLAFHTKTPTSPLSAP